MNTEMNERFAAALRSAVVEQATPRRSDPGVRVQRAWWIGGASLAALGATGAAIALVGIPGSVVETPLSDPHSTSGQGFGSVDLGTQPDAATAVHFEFECLATGDFSIGSPGIVVTCEPDDIGSTQTSGLLPLEGVSGGSLPVAVDAGAEWRVEAWFVETEQVPLAKNANGETFGVDSDDTPPELIQAEGSNGRVGYVRGSELEAGSGPEPTSPAEAALNIPSSFVVNLYESDGVTVIGEFKIGE